LGIGENAKLMKFPYKIDFRHMNIYAQFQNDLHFSSLKVIIIIGYYKPLLFVTALTCIKIFLSRFCQTSNIHITVCTIFGTLPIVKKKIGWKMNMFHVNYNKKVWKTLFFK